MSSVRIQRQRGDHHGREVAWQLAARGWMARQHIAAGAAQIIDDEGRAFRASILAIEDLQRQMNVTLASEDGGGLTL